MKQLLTPAPLGATSFCVFGSQVHFIIGATGQVVSRDSCREDTAHFGTIGYIIGEQVSVLRWDAEPMLSETAMHNSVPWHAVGYETGHDFDRNIICDEYNVPIAEVIGEREVANANTALILKAVNHHQKLVVALRGMLHNLDTMTTDQFARGADKPMREIARVLLSELE